MPIELGTSLSLSVLPHASGNPSITPAIEILARDGSTILTRDGSTVIARS